MAQWFYASDGLQQGPFDENQVREMVRAGRVADDDLVWCEGMAEWAPLHSVPQLLPPAQPAAPPWPPPVTAAAPGLAPAAGPGVAPAAGPGVAPVPPWTLPYATPATAPVAPAPLYEPEPDPGPFLKVGGMFTVKGARWGGPAVASPKALYLLKVARHTNYHGGGLVGVLVAAALTKDDDTRTCDLIELPPPVRSALDPKGKRTKGGDVIVLRREAISLVKVGRINNVVRIDVGGDRFGVTTGLFGMGRVRRFLTDNGWTVNAPVVPTAAPTHGAGYGRPPGVAAAGRSVWARVALIVLAVLVLVIVIAAAVFRGG